MPSDGPRIRLLMIETEHAHVRSVGAAVAEHWEDRAELVVAPSLSTATRILGSAGFDVVLADCGTLALEAGLGAGLERLSRLADGALIVALSDGRSVSVAVEAMRSGAHDTLTKPLNATVLGGRLEELGRRHGKARALAPTVALEAARTGEATDFEGFVGHSAPMREIYDQIVRVASSQAPVFITGESGTGKEMAAQALHRRGPRPEGPFIAINAGAIPHDLLESELFGSVRGAFSGAHRDRKGAAELADGGTLYLDEIGEMDLALQAKLLRFLQTGTIARVGDATAHAVDVRIVVATNRNPMQLVHEGRFREDLFYRLHVLPIHLPPLRQRPCDILPLAHGFLARFAREEGKRFSGFAPEVADLFVSREWPGNVRQLQNLVRRIVVLADGGEVDVDLVTAADFESRAETCVRPELAQSLDLSTILPMWRQEQKIIEEALAAHGGNIARAAAALEISPSTIYRKRLAWEREGRLAGAA